MTRAILFTVVILTGLTIGLSYQTQANTGPDYITLIENKNEKMSELLENRGAMQQAISFLHENISETATFEMSMSNTTMPKDAPQQNFKMSKADYINSFIKGTHYVADYDISIKTVAVDVSQDGKTAISQEIMTEQGVSLNPYDTKDSGKPFISTTKCLTTHALNGEKAISIEAKCHTDTSFLSAI